MREKLARWIAFGTGALVLLIALVFALLQNGPPALEPASISAPPAELSGEAAGLIAKGRAVYDEQFCAACHSIAGEGNTRVPLDGVGARLSPEEIRLHIAPPDSLKEKFPASVFDAKQAFRNLLPEEMEALVRYLGSLK